MGLSSLPSSPISTPPDLCPSYLPYMPMLLTSLTSELPLWSLKARCLCLCCILLACSWVACGTLQGGEPSNRRRCTPPPPGIRSDFDLSFYRSFEPILRLLPQGISPVSQHWATWALYNLVSVYREYTLALCSDTGMLTWLRANLSSGSS